ncbi:MAG: hypothetical protein ACE361_23960 [Aureliella sp.]
MSPARVDFEPSSNERSFRNLIIVSDTWVSMPRLRAAQFWVTRHRKILPLLLTIVILASNAIACDYTVRDIGFVPFNKEQYTLVVRCNAPDPIPDDFGKWLSQRRVGLQLVPAAEDQLETTWRIELKDARGRKLLLASSDSHDSFPDLKRLLDELFDTPRMNELREQATSSFAQIVFIAGAEAAARDVAVEASGAMKELEPMLPRPVNLPIHVLDLAPQERSRERLLFWCLEQEIVSGDQSAIAVLYGRGRLAGPVLSAEQLTIENVLRQLALVGESCECDTSRDWTLLPEVPMFWNDDDSKAAELALGFDPASEATLVDVKEVLSRGRRGADYGQRSDRLDEIVTGYFEGNLGHSEPTLLAIPPGKKSQNDDQVVATVIQGEGWGFDEVSDQASATNQKEAEATEDWTTALPQLNSKVESNLQKDPGEENFAGENVEMPVRFTAALIAFAVFLAAAVAAVFLKRASTANSV